MADSGTNNQFWSPDDFLNFNSKLFNDHFANGKQFNLNISTGNSFADQELDAKVNFNQTFADKDKIRTIDTSLDLNI